MCGDFDIIGEAEAPRVCCCWKNDLRYTFLLPRLVNESMNNTTCESVSNAMTCSESFYYSWKENFKVFFLHSLTLLEQNFWPRPPLHFHYPLSIELKFLALSQLKEGLWFWFIIFGKELYNLVTRASNEGFQRLRKDITITERAFTRAFSWLKAPSSTFLILIVS